MRENFPREEEGEQISEREVLQKLQHGEVGSPSFSSEGTAQGSREGQGTQTEGEDRKGQ